MVGIQERALYGQIADPLESSVDRLMTRSAHAECKGGLVAINKDAAGEHATPTMEFCTAEVAVHLGQLDSDLVELFFQLSPALFLETRLGFGASLAKPRWQRSSW